MFLYTILIFNYPGIATVGMIVHSISQYIALLFYDTKNLGNNNDEEQQQRESEDEEVPPRKEPLAYNMKDSYMFMVVSNKWSQSMASLIYGIPYAACPIGYNPFRSIEYQTRK